MRLATFNVENMFERPNAMNLPKWSDGKPKPEDFGELTNLAQKQIYTAADKARMITIMARHDRLLTTGRGEFIILNEVRGKLLKKKSGSKPAQIVANGRGDWVGWFELAKKELKEVAVENTARVIREINADVQCVVETESRTALKHFNEAAIPKVNGNMYDYVMLIDGNDDRASTSA